MQVRSLGWDDPLEEGMATHFSIRAWRISWTEEPGRLQSMESQRVRHDWATKYTHTNTHTDAAFIQARSLSLCFLKSVINPEMCVLVLYSVEHFHFYFFHRKKKLSNSWLLKNKRKLWPCEESSFKPPSLFDWFRYHSNPLPDLLEHPPLSSTPHPCKHQMAVFR